MADPVWVSKDTNGNINGVYANPQSFPVTETTADDPAVVAFLTPNPVPQSVSPRQARLALLQAGLLTQVQNAVNAADQPTQLTWEFASSFERNSPLISSIGSSLNLTSAQIDQLFITAATL